MNGLERMYIIVDNGQMASSKWCTKRVSWKDIIMANAFAQQWDMAKKIEQSKINNPFFHFIKRILQITEV